MNIAQYFVKRPILACVLSLMLVLGGLISLPGLPISQYPQVVPPTVVVHASYPGANPQVIARTVATPLEKQLNGIDNMLYTSSQATSDGRLTLTVTFAVGTDVDKAQVQVQNRVAQALPRLPEEVQRLGVTTRKSSPNLAMVVHLVSPDGTKGPLYLANYARLRVQDELKRVKGVGDVQVFGAGSYSMRVWLNPGKLAARGLSTGDVVRAIRGQNMSVAAGALNASPAPANADFQLLINARGRLSDAKAFRKIVLRTGADGGIVHLGDVARVELGADSYALRSLLDNKDAVGMGIFQQPGSNALDMAERVRATMDRLSHSFPEGVQYRVVYDTTTFVHSSIDAVLHTLLEAILLVVLVVILFLQTWRASIIPLVSVPVSLIGTFAVMKLAGFSLNTLSLFGMVLAIGIVVDDAIVVVENVERNIADGHAPVEATRRAMREVTGPIVATALVLCAVFVPVAFIGGLTGQFYRQFALTIAISTVISAFNSLTVSPALSALLLKSHDAPRDWLTRWMDTLFGWVFRPFNRFFQAASGHYVGGVRRLLRFSSIALLLYGGLLAFTWFGFNTVPTGFVPQQDKQYLVAMAQLPAGASLDRTEDVVRKMSKIGMDQPGVTHAIAFPGLSINGFTNSSSAAVVFYTLDAFDKRQKPSLSAGAIAGALNRKFASIEGARVAAFPPPPVQGLGAIGGFRLQIEDRGGAGYAALNEHLQKLLGAARKSPALTGVFTSYQVNVPQINVKVDREKAKSEGVDLKDAFQTMQAYLGSLYVNDFNRFGQTYQVNLSAQSRFRSDPEDITRLKTRNAEGDLVPLGSFVTVEPTAGPARAMHYNGYVTAAINGGPAPGYSSGQAQATMKKLAAEHLPNGMTYEWTDLAYQRILAGNTAIYVFPLCVLLVFLVLAALYESWSLPLAVVLIVPMGLLSAIGGVWLTGGDDNIFTRIGLIVLVGLACKNAILIVEFARERQAEGMGRLQAVLEAARLRLRPILMTSIAFIMGVVPLVLAEGAGAEMRHAMGVAVFYGMLGVTTFGLIFTPVFYFVIRGLLERRRGKRQSRAAARSGA